MVKVIFEDLKYSNPGFLMYEQFLVIVEPQVEVANTQQTPKPEAIELMKICRL